GLDPRDVPAHLLHLVRTRQLAGCLLHAKVELFLAQVEQFVLQLLHRLRLQLLRVHHITCRVTKAVLTGSFAAASLNASRAISSVTPSISYSTKPGWIFAAQYSTPPLPLPMRTSSGFLVTGTSGNTRIQILPPRFT